MRRFTRLAKTPAFAARHRAFAARLPGGREDGARAPGVARVLRRLPAPVVRRMGFALNLALRFMQGSVPAPLASQGAHADRPFGPALTFVRARARETHRFFERAFREMHVRHSRMLLGVAQAVPPSGNGSTPPASRAAMLQRIEHRSHFPRVSQVVARASGSAAARADPARNETATIRDARPLVRSATPFAVSTAAAASLPPAELSRVTDHVIQQLDRRVLSYRERMGL